MIRAERAALSVPRGDEVLQFLRKPSIRKLLVSAAGKGQPPVAAISRQFADALGEKDVRRAQLKQFAGLCIRAILDEEGFEVERSGVWLGDDPVFSTGSVYKKVPAAARRGGDEWLNRFATMLDDTEAGRLLELLRKRLER